MSHNRIYPRAMRHACRGARPIHTLEYLLLVLSNRIRCETGNDDLADAASQLASASHDYGPMLESEQLSEMCNDWRRRFDISPEQSTDEGRARLLPRSVRYIKNGSGGKWWAVAKASNQLHAKWDEVPAELLQNPDSDKIKACYQKLNLKLPTQDLNALRTLIDHPSQYLWVTFEDDYLWWSLVNDGVTNLGPSTDAHGHFFISCQPDYPWSNKSLAGKALKITELPGPVTSTAGFRATICEPRASEQILRLILDERNPAVVSAQGSRQRYEVAIEQMIKQLHWKDFELLISLILDQTGWTRWSPIGGSQKSIDLDVKNLVSQEHAYVQVKSEASQAELTEYIEDFKAKPHYDRLVFAVHTPSTELRADSPAVHVWAGNRLAKLVVDAGMGTWLETKLA